MVSCVWKVDGQNTALFKTVNSRRGSHVYATFELRQRKKNGGLDIIQKMLKNSLKKATLRLEFLTFIIFFDIVQQIIIFIKKILNAAR